jgi:hypothetical protein
MQWKSKFTVLSLFFAGAALCSPAAWATEEPELVIVKYGSLLVNCPEPGARVYVDNSYKGGADSIIESIAVGEHEITCRTDDKSATGTFTVKRNETLKLEADLDGGKLVLFREPAKQTEKAPEVVEKKRPEPVKPKKVEPKKVEPKKVEQKNPVEERRKSHLNVMKIKYGVTDAQDVKFEHAGDQRVISKFSVKKDRAGKYYRTKQGVLLCDTGPCEMAWSATFIYTDETGNTDALLMNWKETVFNGITPAGTSRQDLECCLNGQCWKMQEDPKSDEAQEFEVGRFRLVWNESSIVLRRSDIMQEVIDAGRSLNDY